jgi:hypothetical protein
VCAGVHAPKPRLAPDALRPGRSTPGPFYAGAAGPGWRLLLPPARRPCGRVCASYACVARAHALRRHSSRTGGGRRAASACPSHAHGLPQRAAARLALRAGRDMTVRGDHVRTCGAHHTSGSWLGASGMVASLTSSRRPLFLNCSNPLLPTRDVVTWPPVSTCFRRVTATTFGTCAISSVSSCQRCLARALIRVRRPRAHIPDRDGPADRHSPSSSFGLGERVYLGMCGRGSLPYISLRTH